MWPFSRKTETTAQPDRVQLIARDDAADETRSLADPEPWLLELFGVTPSLAGVNVSPSTAMRSPAVRAAVEAISEAIGGLPLHVYQRDGEARHRAPDHPAYALLHDEANDWTPASLFREQLTRDALLWGNGYAYINRRDGQPVELIRLQPSAVSVDLDRITGEPVYSLSDASRQRTLDRREVLHIAAPSIDGVSGASPVMQCREAIAVSLAIEKHVARLFSDGGRPSGALMLPRNLTVEALAKMKASWRSMVAGGGPAILDGDTKYQQLTLTSVDAQTLELWQHSVHEICRIFRVPPHLVFELGRATWGNAGEMGATFLRFTLDRWLKVWEGEIRLKLIAPEDRATFYPEFLTDALLRADLPARADAYGKLIASRVLNPNEARARENLPPYEGGDEFANPHITTTTTTTAPAKTGAAMADMPMHRQFFGDAARDFRLTPPLILELERKTGAGIGALSRRVFSSDFRHADLLEIVRLALVGGGTDPEEAAALVAAYAAPAPVMSTYALAVAILELTMFGEAGGDDDGG